MSGAAAPESVTIAALPERAGLARVFAAGVLGGSDPHADLAVLDRELAARSRWCPRLLGCAWDIRLQQVLRYRLP